MTPKPGRKKEERESGGGARTLASKQARDRERESSLSAWPLTVVEGPSRNPATSDIDIRKGDSFVVVWDDGDWSLLETMDSQKVAVGAYGDAF